jgi:hypothetical protein
MMAKPTGEKPAAYHRDMMIWKGFIDMESIHAE